MRDSLFDSFHLNPPDVPVLVQCERCGRPAVVITLYRITEVDRRGKTEIVRRSVRVRARCRNETCTEAPDIRLEAAS